MGAPQADQRGHSLGIVKYTSSHYRYCHPCTKISSNGLRLSQHPQTHSPQRLPSLEVLRMGMCTWHGLILAGSYQLHRGVGVGYRGGMAPKTSTMNELDQCLFKMAGIFGNQVLMKWEAFKDTRSEQKINDFDRNFIKI